MKTLRKFLVGAALLALLTPLPLAAAGPKTPALVCVSLVSETSEGQIGTRTGTNPFKVLQVGDVVAPEAEIQVTVGWDWAEFVPQDDPTTVYYLEGKDGSTVTIKAADLVKTKARKVSFPKAGKDTDPAFKNKLVVAQVTGRQVYRASPQTSEVDIHYGLVLDIAGKVKIIGINNPLVLMFPNGATTKVIGPLNFEVKKVFEGTSLYKYLNVTK